MKNVSGFFLLFPLGGILWTMVNLIESRQMSKNCVDFGQTYQRFSGFNDEQCSFLSSTEVEDTFR